MGPLGPPQLAGGDLRARGRAAPALLRIGAIALVTAGIVAAIGGSEAFWVSVPAVLLAIAVTDTRAGAIIGAAIVTAAAATSALAVSHAGPPPPALALLVPAASAAVLIVVRERLERDRDVLRSHALRDPLTGISNRRSLLIRADYEIARHVRARSCFAVVMLDLDGFKPLNDRYGHAAGDDLLREVAIAIKRALRAPDTVARIGGDEFCVLAPETDEPGTHRLASRISSAVDGVSAGSTGVRASLGIAVFPQDGRTVRDLLDVADERLLAAKRGRKRDRAAARRAA